MPWHRASPLQLCVTGPGEGCALPSICSTSGSAQPRPRLTSQGSVVIFCPICISTAPPIPHSQHTDAAPAAPPPAPPGWPQIPLDFPNWAMRFGGSGFIAVIFTRLLRSGVDGFSRAGSGALAGGEPSPDLPNSWRWRNGKWGCGVGGWGGGGRCLSFPMWGCSGDTQSGWESFSYEISLQIGDCERLGGVCRPLANAVSQQFCFYRCISTY